MRLINVTVTLCLLLGLACTAIAQMGSDQSTQTTMQNMRATVQPGPVLRMGMPASSDVFVGSKLAIRVGAWAGGMSPKQRAEIIAGRLNESIAAGENWQDMKLARTNGEWTVNIGERMIATADMRSARAMGLSQGWLANRWASRTVIAFGGEPQMVAMQIQPVSQMVAGSQQEMGQMMWSNQDTKSVPLLESSAGTQMGEVMIAGRQTILDKANSVVVYETMSGKTTVWTFVPVTGTSISEPLMRAREVGLSSVPANLGPETGFSMGDDVVKMTTDMAAQWNQMINTSLTQKHLQFGSLTKIVPLYSMDKAQVVGAAQIVGNAEGIKQAQTVVKTKSGEMYNFGVTTSMYDQMTGEPSMLSNVMVSSIIVISATDMPLSAKPGMTKTMPAQPEMTPPAIPETTQPESAEPTTPPATEPVPTQPTTPDEGTTSPTY